MKLVYNTNDRPENSKLVIFAFQQVLAIMAATITVPMVINSSTGSNMSTAAAMFGAGVGTLIYVFFTQRKSPVFLGSSFAFIGSMIAAISAAAFPEAGYAGLILGALLAGLVYVILALIIKTVGVDWLNRLMPPVIIGPTVAIIGLSLAGSAISNMTSSSATGEATQWAILCGLISLGATMIASVYGKKNVRMIPFIIGILSGYAAATILTLIGGMINDTAMQIVSFAPFTALVDGGVSLKTFFSVPSFTFLTAMKGTTGLTASYIATIAAAYIPVAAVVFAEHIADHKNISSIIEKDLLADPGLDKTLLGDGVGSILGAFFGGCPNTTYGESVACVAITKNASVATIITAALECILISFLSPLIAFISSIPSCVMGGVCMALYGFIAVSGLKMIQKVNLDDNRNLFVVSTILISGIGGLSLTFWNITITSVATALILGIIVNLVLRDAPDPTDN